MSGEGTEENEGKETEPGKWPEHQLPLGPGVAQPRQQLPSKVRCMEDGEEDDRHPVKQAAGDHLRLHPGEDGHGDHVAGGDGEHVGPDQGDHLQAPAEPRGKTLAAPGSISTWWASVRRQKSQNKFSSPILVPRLAIAWASRTTSSTLYLTLRLLMREIKR